MATIGQLILLTNGTELDASSGFLPCDGRAVKQSDYPALCNVIGTSWGATTNDDFKLPGAISLPAGLKSPASYYICTNGADPSLPAPDAVIGRVERFAFQPTLPLPTGWDRPANQQTIPSNYHPCDGSSLRIGPYENLELLERIGNNYGGEYPATFFLPDVPTDPNFYWGMPHNGYCIVSGDALWWDWPCGPTDDDFIGQIILMPTQFGQPPVFPDGYTNGAYPCNGGVVSIAHRQNQALANLIGNTYGGNGPNTFALPNLSSPPGLEKHTYYIVTDGIYPPS